MSQTMYSIIVSNVVGESFDLSDWQRAGIILVKIPFKKDEDGRTYYKVFFQEEDTYKGKKIKDVVCETDEFTAGVVLRRIVAFLYLKLGFNAGMKLQRSSKDIKEAMRFIRGNSRQKPDNFLTELLDFTNLYDIEHISIVSSDYLENEAPKPKKKSKKSAKIYKFTPPSN